MKVYNAIDRLCGILILNTFYRYYKAFIRYRLEIRQIMLPSFRQVYNNIFS